MKVYIVRHTSVIPDGNVTCYGNSDVETRPTFEQEAEQTRLRLEGIPPVDAVFTSPLSRAAKLAAFVGYPDAVRDDRLREMNFGEWELRPWVELMNGKSYEEFFTYYIDHPTPGGESLMMQYNRVKDFLEEQRARGYRFILVFCHGGVINCARALSGQCNIRDAFAELPAFGSVTELDF